GGEAGRGCERRTACWRTPSCRRPAARCGTLRRSTCRRWSSPANSTPGRSPRTVRGLCATSPMRPRSGASSSRTRRTSCCSRSRAWSSLTRSSSSSRTRRNRIRALTALTPNSARSVRPGVPDLAPELDGVLELSAEEPGLQCEQIELLLLELLRALERRAHHVGGVLEPCAVELDELGHVFSFLGAWDYRSARQQRGFA